MSHQNGDTRDPESWLTMFWPLAFAVGVPFGIGSGVLATALFRVIGVSPSAAIGALIGFGVAVFAGAVAGWWAARHNYKWTHVELAVSDANWESIVKALNVEAAVEHYLMTRREAEMDYVIYSPTLTRAVAAGPLTVSPDYLSVVVARLNATTVTMTGPRHIVDKLRLAATKALEAVGQSEQDAHADS